MDETVNHEKTPARKAPQIRNFAYDPIEKQRILCTKEVAAYLGVCNVTATRIMRESGKAFRLGNRILIKEGNLREHLASLEGKL
ncbi:MAG: helix-turn-helix domain-containing protein [Eggerthellaceae bacterium]|nr:helix-turn-helix domain-containing protein [Eggerthellaceae bacterium]